MILYREESDERKGITVCARSNESFELMVRRFSDKVIRSGVLAEYSRRNHGYRKPSEIRREKLFKSITKERKRHFNNL